MITYADGHNGAYPTGKSSTEIFQKLIDANRIGPTGKSLREIVYNQIKDPAIFWLDMPGKSRPTSDVLKPENVSFDVSVPIDKDTPDELPLVFVTGYKITYAPHGTAIRLPQLREKYWTGVCYKSGNARAIFDSSAHGDDWPTIQPDNGNIINFIPATFNSHGKTYQQLTPDGSLSP